MPSLRTLASTGNQANKKTQYDWDPNLGLAQLVAERDGNATLLRRYRGGLDTVSFDTGGSPFYFHYDGLGSVVNLTNSSGVTQWTYAYLPYGGVRTETKNQSQAPANVLRFTGQVLDPTGLYQLRARSYDPSSGRFISTDPAAAGPSDPYVSAYAYANGNPVRYTDPSGRNPLCGGVLLFAEFGPVDWAAAAACFAVAALVVYAAETTGQAILHAVNSYQWYAESRGDPTHVGPGQPPAAPHVDNYNDVHIGNEGGGRCHSKKCRLGVAAGLGVIIWGAAHGNIDARSKDQHGPLGK